MSEEEWDSDRYACEVEMLTAKIDSIPNGSLSVETFRALIAHYPREYRTATFALMQSIYRVHELKKHEIDMGHLVTIENERSKATNAHDERKRESRAFWAGFFLLLVALAASVLVSDMRIMTALVIRVMAGTGVALLIVYLPGFFSIDSEVNFPNGKVALRATGGLAGLAMVYFFDPGWISGLLHH